MTKLSWSTIKKALRAMLNAEQLSVLQSAENLNQVKPTWLLSWTPHWRNILLKHSKIFTRMCAKSWKFHHLFCNSAASGRDALGLHTRFRNLLHKQYFPCPQNRSQSLKLLVLFYLVVANTVLNQRYYNIRYTFIVEIVCIII